MLLACTFLSFLISHLIFCNFYKFASFIGIFFLFFIIIFFKYKIKFQKNKKLISALIGIFLGLPYAWHLNQQYATIQNTTHLKRTQLGIIIKVSKKSAIVEYNYRQQKYRLRVLTNIDSLNLFRGNQVTFSCNYFLKERNNIFTITQKIQKISKTCRGLIKKKNQYFNSTFEKLSIQVKAWLKKRLNKFPEGSLAEGFILADTTKIPQTEMQFFRKMGIAHLFAASGLHLGLLFAIFYLPFFWLKWPKYGEILGLLFCTFFLLLLDFPTSLLRAYLFLVVYLGLKLIDRKTSPFYIYFFVACFSELIYPLSAFSYSFILSFGITGIILLTFPFFKMILPIKWNYLKDHLALTLAAFTGSLFLSFILFGYVNILSLLYNFLLVPFAGIYLFLTLISILLPDIAQLLFFFDQVFYWSAQLHQLIWERFFTSVHSLIIYLWLSLIFIFFVFTCIFMMKKKKWYVKQWFFPISFVLILLYYVQFLFINNPSSGVKAFPYGILFYKDKKLYVLGKIAPFIKNGAEKFFARPEIPIEKIYASSFNIKKYVKRNTTLHFEKIYPLSFKRQWNVLQFKNRCFLFMTKKFNLKYAYQNTKTCSFIYMISSKKKRKALRLARQQLKQTRKNAHIFMSTYNYWRWYP